MDVRAHLSVLWRFRALMAIGLVVGIALATFSVARPTLSGGHPGLRYRKAVEWTSSGVLLVGQTGAPYGRSTLNDLVPAPGAVQGQTGSPVVPRFADPSRYSDLAVLYARLVESDPVQRLVRESTRVAGSVTADVLSSGGGSSTVLPFVSFTGLAYSPAAAREITAAGMSALVRYIKSQQASAAVPTDERVVLTTVNLPSTAVVAKPRSKMIPIVVLFAVMAVFIGFAFVLENLRPRLRVVADEPIDAVAEAAPRRAHG